MSEMYGNGERISELRRGQLVLGELVAWLTPLV
jgi:hypothetical protein